MRTLIYVPIIHTGADLGSMAKDIAKRGIEGIGEEIWLEHRRTVDGFWDVISRYFDSADVSGVKIYQDGMVAEGEAGEKIVEETSGAGSKNYVLISKLLERGAFLVKTEDLKLVLEERDRILRITQAKGLSMKLLGFIRYKLTKNALLNKRDRHIAGRIDETLNAGERGIIFIGAEHNIKERLPGDVKIIEIKDADRVREYHRLLPFCNERKERFRELAGYLVSEISVYEGSKLWL